MHRASCFSSSPEVPNLWKVHLVSLHKSLIAKVDEELLMSPGEDVHHGVDSVLLISVGKGDDLNTKSEKCSVEKPVQQKHLT